MIDRRDLGSWISGPQLAEGDFPGRRLGMPRTGPGSVGRTGRRVLGLCIDWAASYAIAAAFLGGSQLTILAVFAVEQVLLVGLVGHGLGHRLAGLTVRRLDGSPVGIPRAALRTLLLCLVIPAVVFDPDQRGVHDKAAGTVVVRL
ncbi:RDD family protein [Sinomonas atrocyanea]|uniref:RDD family protein n=1 Tax=Sinomonas atrocyanea TaxID=37927 RepID=UPI00277F658C|nr:RDD family protein [Sinomonas atrocyanea]MDP9885145.1 putative RDD family membrane protein YckC [Sinomonas atrocyanea]